MGDKMKKIYSIFVMLLLVIFISGCESNLMNTPTKRVETMLNNYITLNSGVLDDLDETLLKDKTMNDNQKMEYKKVIKKLYQNMSYEIIKETIDGNNATVEVEIEVYNLKKAIDKSNSYLQEHKDEFLNDDKSINNEKFNDYKLNELKNAKDKVTYTLNLTLKKVEDKWVLDNLTDTDISKIHGMYDF